jgi:hypothetical protein
MRPRVESGWLPNCTQRQSSGKGNIIWLKRTRNLAETVESSEPLFKRNSSSSAISSKRQYAKGIEVI